MTTTCVKCGTDSAQTLTPRELSVAAGIAEGLSNHELAVKLFLADKTAKNLVSAVLMKLGAANRTQIAIWYLRRRRGRYTGADLQAAFTAGWKRHEQVQGL